MKLNLKNEALILRRKGFSFKEISDKLKISKSTASLWLRGVELSEIAKKRIHKLGVDGRNKGVDANRKKIESEDFLIEEKIKEDFDNFVYRKIDFKIACALLYWGEGTKHDENSSVSFINSDPEMIKYFLHTLRNSFKIDEKKFRGLIHLHEYHDEKKQLKFWSSITRIPVKQFNKSYLKKNTGKNKKIDYPGCLSIRYSDVKIYKEIMFIIRKLAKI